MNNIIEDEMLSMSVIRDMSILDFDYVPEQLIHRDNQLRQLSHLFKPVLSRIAQNVVIKGPVGCGKTVLAKKFCSKLIQLTRKNGIITEYVHINCRKRSTDAMTLLGILNHFDSRFPDRGFSVQEMLEVLRKQLKRRNAQLIIVLDEADALFKKGGTNLIYSLTRFSDENSIDKIPISLILISQKDVFSMMDPSSISSLKRSNILSLNKYSRNELFDIIKKRTELAFHKGTVHEDCIDLIADISLEWGDARFAIELLWKAGMAADQRHEGIVTPEDVRAAKAETYSVITESKLKNLDRHQLITLNAIAKRLKKDGTAYVNTGEAEKTYKSICEEFNEKPRTHTMFWNYLKEIENAGFINIKLSGKGHLGTTQLISLPDIPAEIVQDKVHILLS